MPFNGSGVFQRVRNWVADATAGIKIRADYHDTEDDGFAAGLSNCIARDGQSIVTQNIPFNSKRITGLADPISPQDAATKASSDANANTRVLRAGDTMTGKLTSSPSGIIGAIADPGSFEVYGAASNAAMSFNCGNVFAANFGLSNDGYFYMGGRSVGAGTYRFWTTRDFTGIPASAELVEALAKRVEALEAKGS